MNIAIVTQTYFPDTLGGAGRYASALACGMARRGHQVTVFTQVKAGLPAHEAQNGLTIRRYPALKHTWDVPPSTETLRRQFLEAHRARPFDVVSMHQPLPGLALLKEPTARGLPWVYHFHSPWGIENLQYRLGWRRLGGWYGWRVRQAIEARVVRHARRHITLSHAFASVLRATHKIPGMSIQVVPGWVDLERFRPAADRAVVRRALGIADGQILILTVRPLVPRQNLDALIRAMSGLAQRRPAVSLVMIGGGPLRDRLNRLIATLGLQHAVRLAGRVPDEDLPAWYQAADVFVMPSKTLEGFGLSSLEALACGTPCVGTPSGGTVELLGGLDPRWLCSGFAPADLENGLEAALSRLDVNGPADVRAACRRYAEGFSETAALERLERLYEAARRRRVLHVHTLPVLSGSGFHVLEAMRGQRASGWEASLACASPGPLLDRAEAEGFAVHRLLQMTWAPHPVRDVLAVAELVRLLRRHPQEVVHTHNSKAGFIGRLAGRLARAPAVIHTVHGFSFHEAEAPWRRRLYRALERMAAPWCDRLIFISRPLLDWAVREGIGRRAQMVLIYSGIDISPYHRPVDVPAIRRALGISPEAFLVGEVAKLWEGKGHDTLLRAAAALRESIPPLRLLIIGDGPLRASLELLAEQLHLQGCARFTGYREDVPELTQALDVAVLPSLFEGMGRAILEAQAAGKAVVASRVGGIPDIVKSGVTGLLIEPGSVQELAGAIQQLYEQPHLRRELGGAARRAVDERFCMGTMVAEVLRLYVAVLAARTGRDAFRTPGEAPS